ncbi:uncharacterized protein At4g37920 [Mercurialis annua]|uniref:uncharacterized protein At4g37920 n=1 Tax=Mercurialis annua TaxID=3986 RepID=UPI00215F1FFF|nr:uncharacterized protein At4g37920 [Mercurialis annua]XP_055959691.1 uncharacterized protein At4g37920 [Mercurialis annua]
MSNCSILKLDLITSITQSSFCSINDKYTPPITISPPLIKRKTRALAHLCNTSCKASSLTNVELEKEEKMEAEIANGYSITQFCDKMIDVFLNEKPRVKEWRKFLVFREEWNKYRESFYTRCQVRADMENDLNLKQKFVSLATKLKRIDEEMEKHSKLLKEIQDSPTELNALVTMRRKDFTGDFFRYLTLISDTYDSLEDRDAIARLGTRCLSAVSAFDKTLEYVDTLDTAQAKFNDILDSYSVDAACEKIKSLAKSKELDSSLILLINSAWAAAKDSKTMKNEVKEIMYQIYKATKSSLKSITPKELKLLKYLLNIADPDERFAALATAFCPGDDREAKDPYALYTTPKELHKWIKITLDAYQLNKEDTDIREAKRMAQPVVMQRLFILKEIIEDEYLEKTTFRTQTEEENSKTENL